MDEKIRRCFFTRQRWKSILHPIAPWCHTHFLIFLSLPHTHTASHSHALFLSLTNHFSFQFCYFAGQSNFNFKAMQFSQTAKNWFDLVFHAKGKICTSHALTKSRRGTNRSDNRLVGVFDQTSKEFKNDPDRFGSITQHPMRNWKPFGKNPGHRDQC